MLCGKRRLRLRKSFFLMPRAKRSGFGGRKADGGALMQKRLCDPSDAEKELCIRTLIL